MLDVVTVIFNQMQNNGFLLDYHDGVATGDDDQFMPITHPLPVDLATQRPSWLPDFRKPPVTEVSLAVDLERLAKMRGVHLGLLFERWRDRFPVVQETMPPERFVESFDSPVVAPLFRIVHMESPPIPQVWFVNDADDLAIKLQADAFGMTWRRRSDDYPHYEQLKELFYSGFLDLREALQGADVGDLAIEQAEVRYVNHIPLDDHFDDPSKLGHVFRRWGTDEDAPMDHPGTDLPATEEEGAALRRSFLVQPKNTDAPAARLHVSASQDHNAEGALRLELVVRGFPAEASLESALTFFDMGRALIVQTFTDITTAEMHSRWERFR